MNDEGDGESTSESVPDRVMLRGEEDEVNSEIVEQSIILSCCWERTKEGE